MTLRSRVVLIVTSLVVVGIALASVVAYGSARSELIGGIDEFLVERSNEVIGGVRPAPRPNGRDNQRDANGNLLDLPFNADAVAQTIDPQGTITASGGGVLPVDARDVAVAGGARAIIRDVAVDGVTFRIITAPDRRNVGAVQVARDLTPTNDVLSGLRWRLLAVAMALAALAAALGWLLMRRTTRPLEDLTAATERVAATRSAWDAARF